MEEPASSSGEEAEEHNSIEVTIISAQGLKDTCMFGKMSPYALAWVEPDDKYCTPIAHNAGCNPAWDHRIYIPRPPAAARAELELRVCVYNRMSGRAEREDPLLGSTSVPLADVNAGRQYMACQLQRPSGRIQGLLNMSVRTCNSDREALESSSFKRILETCGSFKLSPEAADQEAERDRERQEREREQRERERQERERREQRDRERQERERERQERELERREQRERERQDRERERQERERGREQREREREHEQREREREQKEREREREQRERERERERDRRDREQREWDEHQHFRLQQLRLEHQQDEATPSTPVAGTGTGTGTGTAATSSGPAASAAKPRRASAVLLTAPDILDLGEVENPAQQRERLRYAGQPDGGAAPTGGGQQSGQPGGGSAPDGGDLGTYYLGSQASSAMDHLAGR